MAKKHILIVEDEPNIAGLYREFLKDDYHTTVCSDGEQALHFFNSAQNSIDLVITDQTMPKMHGRELCLALLSQKPDLPIIMVTGFNEYVSAENASDFGIKYFYLKPVSLVKLHETICLYLTND